MNEFICMCMKNIIDGIGELPKDDQEKAFKKCARSCASSGILEEYRKLYEKAGKDPDKYFNSIDFDGCARGSVRVPGKVYELMFPKCLCDLHTEGAVQNGCLCECSKQSVIFVLETIAPEYDWTVTIEETVIRGGDACVIRCEK